jgi:hypothetical protein
MLNYYPHLHAELLTPSACWITNPICMLKYLSITFRKFIRVLFSPMHVQYISFYVPYTCAFRIDLHANCSFLLETTPKKEENVLNHKKKAQFLSLTHYSTWTFPVDVTFIIVVVIIRHEEGLDVFWPRLLVSSKVFQFVFVHLVYVV